MLVIQTRITAHLRGLKIIWILNCKFNDVQSGIANSAQQGFHDVLSGNTIFTWRGF